VLRSPDRIDAVISEAAAAIKGLALTIPPKRRNPPFQLIGHIRLGNDLAAGLQTTAAKPKSDVWRCHGSYWWKRREKNPCANPIVRTFSTT